MHGPDLKLARFLVPGLKQMTMEYNICQFHRKKLRKEGKSSANCTAMLHEMYLIKLPFLISEALILGLGIVRATMTMFDVALSRWHKDEAQGISKSFLLKFCKIFCYKFALLRNSDFIYIYRLWLYIGYGYIYIYSHNKKIV